MIRKVGSGYKVFSESGKPLSKIMHSHSQAMKRLRQIEWFKMRGGKK